MSGQVSHKDTSDNMMAFTLAVARLLVDNADGVEISEIPGTPMNVLELKVAKEDIGKVIGRSGRTAEALRTLVNCGAEKQGMRFNVQIVDK